MLWQFVYILLIERFAPYELDRDDVIQFIASVQLFLTLFAGLLFKLRDGSNLSDSMATREKETYGVICIVLNVTVLTSGIASIFLATSSGKACVESLCGTNSDDENNNKKNVQVAPTAHELVEALSEIRSKYGAASKEYKAALTEKMKTSTLLRKCEALS